MFWDWLSFFVFSMGACAAIANTVKAEGVWGRLIRLLEATVMFMLAVNTGTMNILTVLGV